MSNSLLLVDGMAVLFRAYFASAYGGYVRKTKSGVPVNAIHGFVRYLFDAVRTYEPTHVAVCWDMSSRTFRTERYAAYKGNRPEAPDDLIPQFDLVKEVVEAMDVPNVGVLGYEADDCIGTIARKYGEEMDVLILTGDHDLLQLVTERVKVVMLKKGFGNYAVYDEALLYEEKQLKPAQVIDLKGLIGDSSDNYPGVKGIGEKTATKLLAEYGTIEGILENLESLSSSVRKKIEADLDMLHLSRELATIHCEVPLECDIDACRWAPDPERVGAKFEELEFRSLLKDIV
ncbi:5'-3' exonuclease [Paenibacillus sp.]|uniref:5'-3' exonuclease n=1 Tax=Paenibacillus sp. TaxID=58172 RepID=UPI002D271A44|nr:5'-3' exonuclease H3TH domain-containing protein [Paenibacillus sp.]HZG83771.1 5'-3' exonuclease H3TH domain-containing protein [Paenibacillus sp.]